MEVDLVEVRRAEVERILAIWRLGDVHHRPDAAQHAVNTGQSVAEFERHLNNTKPMRRRNRHARR